MSQSEHDIDFEKILLFGAIAAGLYLAYQASQLAKKGAAALGTATDAAGNAIGGALYNLMHAFSPDPGAPTTYYTVAFPGGQNNAVLSTLVGPDGKFPFLGALYQLLVDQNGMKVAQLISDPANYEVIWIDGTLQSIPGSQVDDNGNYSIGVTNYRIAVNPNDYNYHATIVPG